MSNHEELEETYEEEETWEDYDEDDSSHLVGEDGRYLNLSAQMEDLGWTLEDIGWTAGDPSPHLFRDLEDFQEAARRQRQKVDMEEAVSKAVNPGVSQQEAAALYRKNLSPEERHEHDLRAHRRFVVDANRAKLKELEDTGLPPDDPFAADRARFEIREAMAEIAEEEPLPSQVLDAQERAVRYQQAALNWFDPAYADAPVVDLDEVIREQYESPAELTICRVGKKVYQVHHPGYSVKEFNERLLGNDIARQFPYEERAAQMVLQRIGAGRYGRATELNPKTSRPKPKTEPKPELEKEIVVETAQPGKPTDRVEQWNYEEIEQETANRKEPRGPRPKIHIFSRM